MTVPSPLTLDVRDILRAGGEPFDAIMQSVSALAPGQSLRLLATFRPVPLFAVMEGRGFTHAAQQLPDGVWEVRFTPKGSTNGDVEPANDATAACPSTAFGIAPTQSLDNRGLPPPEPMLRTLEAVEKLPPGAVLEVLVDREPLILYGELKTRGHAFRADKQDDACFRVVIQRSVH